MEVDVIDLLMGQTAVILQHVEILRARGLRDVLCDLQDLEELVVGNVGELDAVVFRDDELRRSCKRERVRGGEELGPYRVAAA